MVNDQKPEFQILPVNDTEFFRKAKNYQLENILLLWQLGVFSCIFQFSLLEFGRPPAHFRCWSLFTFSSLFGGFIVFECIIGIKEEDVIIIVLFHFFPTTFLRCESFLQRADEGVRVLARSLINYPLPMEMSATSFDGHPF